MGVLGRNGTGKSHFLRLLAGDPAAPTVEHEGRWRLGAHVVPGHFTQTHDHPEPTDNLFVSLTLDSQRPREPDGAMPRTSSAPRRSSTGSPSSWAP